MENSFKQWLLDNYSYNELADISNHGCTGGVGGMIYYRETLALYERFKDDIHEIMSQYKNDTGEYPDSVIKELGNFQSFANNAVWFASEYIAHEFTQGEYSYS